MRKKLRTDPQRSALMARIRQRRTAPEEAVASVLRELGVGYRRNVGALPGSPDFANRSGGWAIYVNGCFWHRHKHCPRTTTPTRNKTFWLEKFAANEARDRRNLSLLKSMGLRPLVVWECQTKDSRRLAKRLSRTQILK